ncbi:MAG: TVP38/TMEM64 family protein, partial [Pseudonocardiaceae bacterium]
VEDFLTRHGAVAVMESRIVPLLPYGLVNYSAGLTRLRFRDMASGTVIGAAPKVFAYTALGGSLDNLDSPEAIVAVALLATLALAGALFVRRQIALGRAT